MVSKSPEDIQRALDKVTEESKNPTSPKSKPPKKQTNHQQNQKGSHVSAVQTVDGKRVLRIPWVNRLKVNVQRMLYVLPVTMLYCMYVTWDAGELGVNTAWACGVALAIQVGTIIIIKFTNAEDFWEEYKEF